MITFNNYKNHHLKKAIDITVPNGSVLFLETDFLLTEKPYTGEILFENFPIHFAKESFQKKVFTSLNINTMFEKRLSIAENIKIYAEIFESSLIWNLPLKYFKIPEKLWNLKVKSTEKEIIDICKIGILLLCRQKILYLQNVPEISSKYINNIQNIITSKATYGNSFIIYSGVNLKIENEIKISC